MKEIVGPLGTEIIALALSPLLDSIVRIARLPDGAQVGIFCISSSFAEKMLSALRNAGINHLPLCHFFGAGSAGDGALAKLTVSIISSLPPAGSRSWSISPTKTSSSLSFLRIRPPLTCSGLP